MLKNKILEKLLAIVLIFTLTFANFAFVTKSYAGFVETLFGGESSTGNKNVEFEAYFGTEDETSVISDVNNNDVKLNLMLNVQKSGYLKDAKIEFAKNEETGKLNFEVGVQEKLPDYVRLFENNTIYLNQIDTESEVKMEVPIEYKNEEYVSEEKAASESKVVFTGTYVNEEGEEEEVTKEVAINVIWKDERKVEVEEEATKYIDYGEGVILQTVEKVNTGSEGKTLPVKETELEIEVPVLKDQKPSKITVVANTTKGTNGEEAGEVKFGEENWNYNEEENKLTIKVNNEKQKVEIKENEEEYLQDEETEVKEEERYVNSEGTDEYVVTYTYEGLKADEEVVKADTKVKAKMTTLSGVEKEENKNIVENEKEYNYELKGQSGNIVSLNKENKKAEASKAYTYVNYNNEGKYETEIIEDMIVNISYKEIVEGIEVRDTENAYVDKNGEEKATEDMYYKVVRIGKENFESILGENGEIKVKDEAGNEVIVINKDSEVNENGIIEIGFGEKYSRLSFETSKPEGEGNLVISTVKAIGKASIEKEELAEVEKVESKAEIVAKYSYVEQEVEVGEAKTETKLVDTNTEANLVIDRESLSTVEENKDVEMRVELNNARETSDVYGNSEFEIEMPEYVEGIEITNESILYGEGLEISKTEVEGRIIRIGIEGKQEGINSGVLTNGTNIVINANIKVNMFAPAKNEKIEMRYTNEEATNYVGEGKKEVEISYSAPRGLVAATRISNYDEEGSTVTSIKQGKQEGIIGVYGAAREAENEIIIMNNNSNTVGNISILGRIASKGVKDIISGEELGTTIDSKMTGEIISGEGNRGNFIIYYSENGEATKDLEDSNNGWTREIDNIENIKSYLIVPEDPNYEMESAEVLRFSYNVTIPENLKHNETILGTYGVYYRNNSELAKTDEISIADLVGLTTGQGPEISLTMNETPEKVKENEEFGVTSVISNTGKSIAEDVVVEFPIPAASKYSRYEIDNEKAVVSEENGKIVARFSNLEIGETINFKVYLIAEPLEVEKDYQDYIEPVINLTAKDLGATLTANGNKIEIEFAEFYINEEFNTTKSIQKAGDEIVLNTVVVNSSTETKNNVVVTKIVPKQFTFVSANGDYNYNENERTITWNLGNVDVLKKVDLSTRYTVNELDENVSLLNIDNISKVKADNSDEYASNSAIVTIGKAALTINQTTDTVNTYLKEGDVVNYTFNIKNDGSITAQNVNLKDQIPEGIVINNVSYTSDGIEINRNGYFHDNIDVNVNIKPGEEWKLDLVGTATPLGGSEEQSATNVATVTYNGNEQVVSNSITHIVEATDDVVTDGERSTSSTYTSKTDTSRTYKINGTAWVDANEDGMRNNNEELLSGVVVKLVNSENGVIKKSITTDTNGTYSFSGVENGTYLVLFEYDTANYKVTSYQKEGVLGNVNSDVISTTIVQDGKTKEGAVTDVITVNNGSISDIDIGLVLANTFDLSIDKTISKVTVQNVKGTTTDNYDNVKLAKTEIASKYLSGSNVYVEYTITVTNTGDLAGYAKKIVDYIPNGMTFNSSLESNKDWYTGSDGALYTSALENIELKAGDSRSVKLVLTKQMTEENTGLVNNQAEIYEDYNTYGIADINSTPANRAQGENDLSSADLIIAVKTGEVFVYVSVIIMTILLGTIAVFVIYNKILTINKKKGGV